MANTYVPEWIVESRPPEKTSGLLHWSHELGVSQQELRSALSSTSVNVTDAAVVSERRRHVERRRDGRRRHD